MSLQSALDAQDRLAFFGAYGKDEAPSEYAERVRKIETSLLEDADFIYDLMANDEAVIACLTAMFKAGKEDREKVAMFAQAACNEFNKALRIRAEKKA